MITALLVDDEPKAIDRLAEMLEAFETVDVIGRARSVDEAERFLRGRAPDVVFLSGGASSRCCLRVGHVASTSSAASPTARRWCL